MKSDFIRKCPACSKEIYYTTPRGLKLATAKNKQCRSCWATERIALDPEFIKKVVAARGDISGDKNPFFGKRQSDSSLSKMSEKASSRDYSYCNEVNYAERNKERNTGDKNPMFGKTFYQIWVEKYGEDVAREKLEQKKQKNSIASSGDKNPMFNKPSPLGSGNGWKGWYKGVYFRSLKEASFMISLEDQGLCYENAENISIEYEFMGEKRTYRPDFKVGKFIYEIKPERLIKTPLVMAKSAAADQFCKENGFIYVITDVNVCFDKISEFIKSGEIVLDERYRERFAMASIPK